MSDWSSKMSRTALLMTTVRSPAPTQAAPSSTISTLAGEHALDAARRTCSLGCRLAAAKALERDWLDHEPDRQGDQARQLATP